MDKWHSIWERLPRERDDKDIDIITGFDWACSSLKELKEFKSKIHKLLLQEIQDIKVKNIFEVGCGCGNNLIPFALDYNLFGIDYSRGMIEKAKGILPQCAKNLHCLYAHSKLVVGFYEYSKIDFTFSYSVFQYFQSHSIAKMALTNIIEVTKKGGVVCIWDIPDIAFKNKIGKKNHRLYSVDFFIKFLKNLGIHDIKIQYFDIPEYLNSRYRFNLTFKNEK